MAINFPNAPPLDSQFSAGDRTWVWNGTYWEAISTTVGYSGSQGNLGYTGSAGAGFTGSAGTNGYTGSAGSTGTQGNIGFTGSIGSTGTQGNVGFTGSIGSTGTQGSAGFTGSAGSTGTQGNIGFTGSIGYTGSRGIDGVTTTTTIAATIVGTTSTTAGIPGFSTKIYNGSLNDGYTLTNGDLYVWKGGDSAGSTATIVEYLVVAGGGAGAYGGGGAGGVLTTSGYVVAAGSPVSLSVGDGGVGANGGNSTFASFTAIGGGRGGSSGAGAGAAGGSGGGASYDYGNASAGAGAGTAGQGNRGGYGSSGAGDASAGGGGGAGAVGTGGYANGTNLASGSTGAGGGAGGIGLLSSISGTPTYYGGGGGGGGNINGANIGNAAPGGLGGGGNGATTAGMPNQAGTDGTANTGGGGGGGDPEVGSANFKRGGSGIVIIRYADTYPAPAATTGSPTAVTTSGYRIYSWTTVGSGSITFATSSPVTGQGWVFVGNIKGIPGEYAAIGYTGSAGTNGYTGSAGSTGTQGNVGFTGSAGSTGTQGTVGFTGSIGSTGTQGSAGYTGSAGIGFTGYSGSAGYTGSAGVGYTGSAGSTGTQGNIGFTGSAGSTGTQGTVGYTGSVGAGYTGSTGYTGSKGESSFTWGDTLPSSPVVGDRWYDTSNSKLVVYVNDGDSTQWVEVAASGFLGQSGYTGSAGAGSTGPKITSVTVTDSSYNNLDDTAVALTGGYIKIAGSGFESGCQVLLGTTLATSVSYISSTEVRAQLPAASTGTYIIYLVNSDGGTAIRVNAVTFSPTPSWTTGAALSGASDTAISIQLAATDATSYALAAGSSLPSGITLSSGGLLSGTITGLSADTAYNFTIVATDAELQDSTRAFTFTITIGDTYFKYVSMLLAGNGTNNAQNDSFLDSSPNNLGITRTGNVSQGTFSPYGSNWSNYFGSANYISAPSNAAFGFGTGDFTVEAWVFPNAAYTTYNYIWATGITNGLVFYVLGGVLYVRNYGNADILASSTAPALNTWTHVAATRSGTTLRIFVNGVQTGTTTNSTNFATGSGLVGNDGTNAAPWLGYISNMRVVKGTAVYTSAFTPSTTPLTAISGTSILTCQSNRFIDTSSNAFAITVSGAPTVQRFSPFSPSAVYSTSTISGSGYFDGNGDYLNVASNTALGYGTGDFEISFWYYAISASGYLIDQRTAQPQVAVIIYYDSGTISIYINGAIPISVSDTTKNAWHYLTLSRVSGTTRLFVNGSQLGSNYTDSNSYGALPLRIGCRYVTTTDIPYNGYMSDLRIIKGSGVSSQTVPTSPLTAITNTSLLVNYTNAGIIDNSMMNNLETVGDAKITTALSKFGSGSLLFDGTGDYLVATATPQWIMSGDWTIESWIYPTNVTGVHVLVDTRNRTTGSSPVLYTNGTSLVIDTGAGAVVSAGTITINTWQHVAATRSGNSWRLFINGTQVGSTVTNSTAYSTAYGCCIGSSYYSETYVGYIDDLRITKGYARYTANFTPPTSALPLK